MTHEADLRRVFGPNIRRLTIEDYYGPRKTEPKKFRWGFFLVWAGSIIFCAVSWGYVLYRLMPGPK